jgi:hypothetical protein
MQGTSKTSNFQDLISIPKSVTMDSHTNEEQTTQSSNSINWMNALTLRKYFVEYFRG